MGCKKAGEFLSKQKVSYETIDVRKFPVSPSQTLKILRKAKRAYVKKGNKILEFDLASKKITQEEMRSHFLGRSGTMRAPVLQVEGAVLVGFDETTYRAVFT